MSTRHSPLVEAAMQIKIEALTAHLQLAEIIIGHSDETIEKVLLHVDKSKYYAESMLEGGLIEEKSIQPVNDPGVRRDITEMITEIEIFKDISQKKYNTLIFVNLSVHEEYEVIFHELLHKADLVINTLRRSIDSDLKKYRYLFSFIIIFLVILVFYVLIVFYRYEKQKADNLAKIKQAYENIKILGGMLPICASCKKIRNDQGYWEQIEAYIRDHSEVEFSHSICQECVEELYPELNNKR